MGETYTVSSSRADERCLKLGTIGLHFKSMRLKISCSLHLLDLG